MKPKIILLVEDNPSDIALTQRAFAKSHLTFHLDVAEDGQEALDYLFGQGSHAGRDLSEIPALVLLDLKMPRLDGFEVLRQIRAHAQIHRLPVVILTTSVEEKDVTQCYELGANSFIRKPVDFTEFVDFITRIGLYWLEINEPPPLK